MTSDHSDYTPAPIATADPLYQFTYTYTRPGIYFPVATVTGTVRGVTMSITQCAAPVIVEADVPYAPTGLSISQLGNDVQLNWDVVDPDDHDGFRIYYSMKRGDSRPILLGETGQTANTFQTNLNGMLQYVTADRPVFFKVTAYVQGDGVTTRELSSKFSNEFKYPDTSIPAPNPLSISNSSDEEVNLTWPAVSSGAGYEVTGYRIYTTTTAGGVNPVLVSGASPIPAGTTAFTYNTVDEDTALYFHAVTVASTGTSARSNEVYWERTIDPEAPVAIATVDPLAGAPPLTVNFDASGSYDPDGDIVEYAWRFFSGDDYHDYTLENGIASHEYVDAGIYTAALRLIDDSGKRTYKSYDIVVNTPPVAIAGANPVKGTMPMTVNFNAEGSSDPDGSITLYEWDFEGDGTFDWSSGANGNIQYVYTAYGVFDAVLRVTDDTGLTGTDTVTIDVNSPPIAEVHADPRSGFTPLIVLLLGSQSEDPDGTIVKYEWDFEGDGVYDYESADSPNVNHTFETSGKYMVRLRVTDDDGIASTDSVEVNVKNSAPTADAQANPTSGSTPLAVRFDGNYSFDTDGTLAKFEWDFDGDGTYDWSSNQTGIVYRTYDTAGSYTAQLRVTDNEGATDTDTIGIEVSVGSWHIETVDSQGDIGNWNSLGTDSRDYVHISYYDNSNGDLKYALYDGALWVTSTVDSKDNVGRYSSIALDSKDNPSISYLGAGGQGLKYAYSNGTTWEIETVDSVSQVVYQTSIAVNSQNRPYVSYFNNGSDDLKCAYYNGSFWSVETIDSTGDVGSFPSIELDSNDRAHISYRYNNSVYDELKYAFYDGISWQLVTVDSSNEVGLYTSLALDSSNKPHISYYDATNANLKYAFNNGSLWENSVIDSTGNVGYNSTSIFIDSSNYPHVSYYDLTNTALKYARFDGSSWIIETVDSKDDVGWFNSIALDSLNRPHISYYDETNGDLKYAWFG